MKRALLAALLMSAAVLAAHESSTASSTTEEHEAEPEQDEEGDSAPFMIVVEHPSGRRCGGSLVSLRTALTSAWCVRGADDEEPRELWALAPGAGAARRVARIALAAGANAASRSPEAWQNAAMDLAVLELEAPFGGGARSRPILMATQPAECAPHAACHVVRALGRTPRLRIVDAELVAGDVCAERSRGWSMLHDSALCLVGPTLCESDWGAGVVCEGKLCGVLSRSARSAGAASPEAGDTCGDMHVAQSVARWRRFLHCAHTLRACGGGGDCEELCSERRLLGAMDTDAPRRAGEPDASHHAANPTLAAEPLDNTEPSDADSPTSKRGTTAVTYQIDTSPLAMSGRRRGPPTRSSHAPPSSTAPPPPPPTAPQTSLRPAFEFEPNRPDFKAGEYGDNAADYSGLEEPAPGSSASASAGPTRSSPLPSPDGSLHRASELQAQVSPSPHGHARSHQPQGCAPAPLLLVLVTITNIAN